MYNVDLYIRRMYVLFGLKPHIAVRDLQWIIWGYAVEPKSMTIRNVTYWPWINPETVKPICADFPIIYSESVSSFTNGFADCIGLDRNRLSVIGSTCGSFNLPTKLLKSSRIFLSQKNVDLHIFQSPIENDFCYCRLKQIEIFGDGTCTVIGKPMLVYLQKSRLKCYPTVEIVNRVNSIIVSLYPLYHGRQDAWYLLLGDVAISSKQYGREHTIPPEFVNLQELLDPSGSFLSITINVMWTEAEHIL
jgi:hypothetical protein